MKKIISNLSAVLIGTSIFVSSKGARLLPLSPTSILVDHDECLQIKLDQASFTLDLQFKEDHFKWNQHPFTLLTFKTSVQTPLLLDTNELPQDLIKLIYSLQYLAESINPYFEEIKIYKKAHKYETELNEITHKINDLLKTGINKLLIINLKRKGTLDKNFYSYFNEKYCYDSSKSEYSFLIPEKCQEYGEMELYVQHLKQLITQRKQLLEMIDLAK